MVERPAAVDPVGARQTHAQRTRGGPRGANGVEHLERERDALVERSAISVSAGIRDRRQEFVQQVAVRHVQLECIDARALCAARAFRERVADRCQALRVQRGRWRLVRGVGDRRWRDGCPAAVVDPDQLSAFRRHVRRALASGMRELHGHGDRGTLPARTIERAGQRRFARVVVKAEACWRDAAVRRDGGCLDREQTGARHQQLAPMDEMPVSRATVDGRVLAHRRHDDAVGKRQLPQPERIEQSRPTRGARRISRRQRQLRECRRPRAVLRPCRSLPT